MNKFKVIAEDAVLVIIDLQERLLKAMKDRERVINNTKLLIATAKQFNIPVIVTEQYPRGLGATVPEIKDELKDYYYFEKVQFSACIDELFKVLTDIKRQTYIVAGTETHVCVFQTVRDLVEAGYKVQVVNDAVCSRFDENYHNGLELMRDLGAVVTNTETVVFDLLKCAGTPEFKAISPLVK
ncbi:hydrolase [Syntrophomonas palmitatica]|uniref:hydrolase n=1 Tax=Syntrophomonas palmitatica TaxID=402877 RepID=UPI0006D1CE7C|nr:hydrolase [Syntrophomonas palmitatica]